MAMFVQPSVPRLQQHEMVLDCGLPWRFLPAACLPRAVRALANTAGTEMCLELVRTRAFAALLSDEVFADVDLETVQVSLPMLRSSTVDGRG